MAGLADVFNIIRQMGVNETALGTGVKPPMAQMGPQITPEGIGRGVAQIPPMLNTAGESVIDFGLPSLIRNAINSPMGVRFAAGLSGAESVSPQDAQIISDSLRNPPKPIPQATLQTQPVQTTQQTQQPIPQEQTPKKEQPQQNNTIQNLLRLGIPIGAAIAGSVNPNLLPQAAGLTTGFMEEVSRQKERETELDKIIKQAELKIQEQNQQAQQEAIRNADKDAIELAKQFSDLTNDPALIARKTEQIADMIKKQRGLPTRGETQEEKYTPEQETLINDNMKAYNKSREEVIAALKNKGKL